MSTLTASRKSRKTKEPALDRDKALLITSSVPSEKGFHFFTGLHMPTGVFATSIFDFLDALKKVDVKSLEFHLKRNDFANWLRQVIRDDSLASEFERLRDAALTGEKMRDRLVQVTEKRCKELADALKSLVR
jgi:hypothetical protein